MVSPFCRSSPEPRQSSLMSPCAHSYVPNQKDTKSKLAQKLQTEKIHFCILLMVFCNCNRQSNLEASIWSEEQSLFGGIIRICNITGMTPTLLLYLAIKTEIIKNKKQAGPRYENTAIVLVGHSSATLCQR